MKTKPPSDTQITFRLPQAELEKLEDYCIKCGKTKTQVLRELVQSLKVDEK